MKEQVTEQEHKLRKHPLTIGHIVTECPKCGRNNFWTKGREIQGEMFYWQQCGSCGYTEA